MNSNQRDSRESNDNYPPIAKAYFASQSMNQTVQLVREKLNKIQSSSEHIQAAPKKTRADNRRRI